MRCSRQEYWSGLLFSPPGDLPDLGIKPVSPVSSALAGDSLPLCHLGSPIHTHMNAYIHIYIVSSFKEDYSTALYYRNKVN